MAVMWKIQQLSELYIEKPEAWETCSDSNGTKALGLKYSTPPLAYRFPWLPFASFSLSLLNFTFPPISSFAVSYTLMVFLLISLPAVGVFHLPLTTQLPEQLQPKSILFTSHLLIQVCAHLVLFPMSLLLMGTRGSPGMLFHSMGP